ncbi:hypothetical protein J1605_014351 [Eschrichtius robustus]|uniref:Uncharacterized protein n=1 Tax=Eschrichtius robustus TaxID=9764 RepID=A0AB34GEZ9_ESCRO|nr:hypothetical protein J1605_014351 [Eschrichtius robustus]
MIIAIALYQQESPSFYRHGHLHPSHSAVERPLAASRRASPAAGLQQMNLSTMVMGTWAPYSRDVKSKEGRDLMAVGLFPPSTSPPSKKHFCIFS